LFQTIARTIPRDPDFPERCWWIDVRTRLLDGSFYDGLTYDFHQETRGEAGQYVPIAERRPSVRTGLLRTVVDDSVSLLFDEDHWPEIETGAADKPARDQLAALAGQMRLNATMMAAASVGAVGSVCLLLRILGEDRQFRPFVQVMNTMYLTPEWDPAAPDTLVKVTECYKVTGDELRRRGYAIDESDLGTRFWFERQWDDAAETWFQPWRVGEADVSAIRQVDDGPGRTTRHELGFVPMVWIKDLPGGDEIDGASTLTQEAIETVIQIDYQLSQCGRGLKYSQDPLLLIKEPAGSDGPFIRSASNAITVDAEGDAKLLEIDGSAASAVLDYCRALREMALEALHGNRASPDKLAAATSGRAMEMMNLALVWLAGRKRITYGDGGLLPLLAMIARASDKRPLMIGGEAAASIRLSQPLSLRWPAWYAPTAQDRLQLATALKTHIDSGTLSAETAVKTIAADYAIADVPAELAAIRADNPSQNQASQ
jgi:hypothetical protein